MSGDLSALQLNQAFSDQFPWLLKTAHDNVRLYDPDYALAKDAAAYEKMHRDPIVKQALQIRYRTAAGGAWECVPARDGVEVDEIAADVMTDIIREVEAFQTARVQLAQAIFRGSAWAQVTGDRPGGTRTSQEPPLRFGDDKPRPWWVPRRLVHVDKRFMRHIPNQDDWGHTVEIFERSGQWRQLTDADYFIRVAYEDDHGRFGWGRGLAESIFFYWYAAMQSVKFGLQGVERWANGVLVGKIDSIQSLGDQTQTTAAIASSMLDTLHAMRTNHAIVHGKEDEVNVIEASGTGHKMAMDFVRFCYDSITRVIAGSRLPSGGGDESTGSLARAEVEQEVSEGTAQMDSAVLDDAITRDLVGLAWRLNADNFADLGLTEARMPKFVSRNESRHDPEQNSRVIVQLLGQGVPIVRSELYERVGLTPPTEDDIASGNVVEGVPQGVPGEAPPRGGDGEGDAEASPFDSLVAEFRDGPERCPDGTIAPKDGDCSGHGPAEDDDESSPRPKKSDDESSKTGEKKRAAPGSQLEPATLDRLKELGVGKLPQADIEDVIVGDLSSDNVHDRPVLAWRDKSGKLQQAYTAQFHERNAAAKFARIKEIEPRIGEIRESLLAAVEGGEVGSREHGAATAGAIISLTGMRPGNPKSAEAGKFGATTLRAEHVSVSGDEVTFRFVGKSGKDNRYNVSDATLAASVSAYLESADEDEPLFGASARDVAEQLPDGVKVKDLRTVRATEVSRRAVESLQPPPPPLDSDPKKAKRQIKAAIREVSGQVADAIQNTPAVARGSYIHPSVFTELEERLEVPDELKN